MLSSQKKNSNYGDIKTGETLFDFLKRKKKFELDRSFSKSRCKENISENRDHIADTYSPRKKCEETHRDTLRESSYNYQTTRRNNENLATTPKRVTFTDGQPKKVNKTGRSSFVQMISPLRRRGNAEANTSVQIPVLSKSRVNDKSRQKDSQKELFHHKNLNKSVSMMKQTLQRLLNTGKNLKNKSHTLLIQLKPLLKYIEEGDNRNFSRKAEQAKLKLRTFEHLFKEFQIENGNQLMEEFHRTLSEHIVSMEGNIRSNYERDELATLRKVKQEKDDKIQQLIIKNEKLEKQLQILTRKFERAERQVNKLQKNCEDQSQSYQKNINTKIEDYQTRICQYQAEISQLAIELDNAKLVEKRMEKQIKDHKYLKEQAEKRFILENTSIKTQREQILINEIELLKSEFKSDMGQLTALYAAKEREQLQVIQQLKNQISELHEKRKCEQDIYNNILSESSTFKQQVQKFKKQNQCLVTDMHRMNEELYQHWIALKDIKTLSNRLGSFSKLAKIYDDIPFNSQLFL